MATPQTDLPMNPDRMRAEQADQVIARLRVYASSDGSGDKAKIDEAKYAKAFAWYDASKAADPDGDGYPDNLGGYKLPIADVIDGKLQLAWRLVAAAGAVMQGARGGVNVPPADRPAILALLERCYAKAASTFKDPSIKPPWMSPNQMIRAQAGH